MSENSEHKSITTIQDEIEEEVLSNKTHLDDDIEQSSNSSEVSRKSPTILPIVVPVITEDNSPVSKDVVDHVDQDEKRHNLVYEITGRLTPDQRRTFEFSDDVFASIKDLKIQVDEYGNETEFVYVQIVRKDSDCYEELLKFA